MGTENNPRKTLRYIIGKAFADRLFVSVLLAMGALLVLAAGIIELARSTGKSPTVVETMYYVVGFFAALFFAFLGWRVSIVLRRRVEEDVELGTKLTPLMKAIPNIAAAMAGKTVTPEESNKAFRYYLDRTLGLREKQLRELNELLKDDEIPVDQKEREAEKDQVIQQLKAALATQMEREKRQREASKKLEEEFSNRDALLKKELGELKGMIAAASRPRAPTVTDSIVAAHKENEERRRRQRELEELRATLREEFERTYSERAANANNGYILIDMPEEQKGVFRELLLGFEEYAHLRGYAMSVSVDTSLVNKLGFKFTLGVNGVGVSPQQVQTDINNYIAQAQSGKLDDLPVVLPPEQHRLVLLALKNRVTNAETAAQMLKHRLDDYKEILDKITGGRFLAGQPQTLYITGGSAQAFAPVQSPNAVLGDNAHISGNTVYIGANQTEREHQAELVEALRKVLAEHREGVKESELERANQNLQNVTEELKEPKPDPSRIHRFLTDTKLGIKAFGMAYEVTEAFRKVWEIFHLTPLG